MKRDRRMNQEFVTCEERPWRVPAEVDELRVAVIGAGKMAQAHLETMQQMQGVKLAAVCSRSAASGEALQRKFNIEARYQDIDQMLAEASADAIFVAVSHAVTFEVSAKIVRTGTPCMLEKPVGYTVEETAQLAQLAAEHRCLNLVGLNRRFYSIINQALLAVLQYGPIRGVLLETHEPMLDYRSRRQFADWIYDNWLTANSIHGIDLLRMIGGEVAEMQLIGKALREPGGDSFTASLEFADGTLGTWIAHWNSARGFGMKIYGEGLTAELWPLEEGFVRYDNGRRIKLQPSWSDIHFKPGLYAQNAAFLQTVCDGFPAPFPASDLSDNVKTMQLIEQIKQRFAGQASVSLNAGKLSQMVHGA